MSLLNFFASKLSEVQKNVFFVQVGAMDGVSFDPIHNLVKQYSWRGILVEPLPDHFASLKESYSGVENLVFENVAISQEQGRQAFYRINAEKAANDGLPDWVKGISSFDKQHLVNHESFHAGISEYIEELSVETTTLPKLLQKNEVARIDILQIDAEGYDYKIFSQLDFEYFKPKIINLEFARLAQNEKNAVLEALFELGYAVSRHELDLLAVSADLATL